MKTENFNTFNNEYLDRHQVAALLYLLFFTSCTSILDSMKVINMSKDITSLLKGTVVRDHAIMLPSGEQFHPPIALTYAYTDLLRITTELWELSILSHSYHGRQIKGL